MIVLDASVLANAVGDDRSAGAVARSRMGVDPDVCVPDLADVETTAVLRKWWLLGTVDDRRFSDALDQLLALPLRRFSTGPLMRRAFVLRANVTPYDAAYVALAEGLGCALVTVDARLARAPGVLCPVQVLSATS